MNGGIVAVLLVVLVCLLQHPGCEGQTKKKTTTTTKTTKTTTTVKVQPYQQKAVKQTNEIRVKHEAPKLTVDGNLLESATKCAEHYANLGKVDNSCPHKGSNGENVWGKKGTWSKDEVSKMATDTWYDEVKNYDFTKATPQANTASFTQLVWKKSDKMGFGVAQKNGFTTGIALFAPPGNVEGQFAENVKPDKNAPQSTTAAPAQTPAPTQAPAAEATTTKASCGDGIQLCAGDHKVGADKDGVGASSGDKKAGIRG